MLGTAEIVLDPVAGHGQAILVRGGVRRVVIGPQQAEFQQVMIAGFEIAIVQCVLQASRALRDQYQS